MQSITTLVLPIGGVTAEPQIVAGREYIIVPRHNLNAALTASETGNVTIEQTTYSDGQRWKLVAEGNNIMLENARGQRLTSFRSSGSSKLTAQTTTSNEQQFLIEAIDLPYYKITPARYRSYAFDLSNANSNAGTAVCTWQYTADTDTPTHRQWMLCPLKSQGEDTGIDQIIDTSTRQLANAQDGIYDVTGRRVVSGAVSDKEVQRLPSGIYIICRNGERKIIIK